MQWKYRINFPHEFLRSGIKKPKKNIYIDSRIWTIMLQFLAAALILKFPDLSQTPTNQKETRNSLHFGLHWILTSFFWKSLP